MIEAKFLQCRLGGMQLTQATVNEHQVRKFLAFLLQALVTASDGLVHVGEIIILLVAHLEAPIACFVRDTFTKDHTRGHHFAALAVADVEALHAARNVRDAEKRLQSLQHGFVQTRGLKLAFQGHSGVFLGH